MKKLMIFAVLAAAAAPVSAAGNANSGFTVGDCMSDVLYGNEPNMADGTDGGPAEQAHGSQAGNVLPSQSPGPFTNDPNDPDNPTFGHSAGAWMREGVNVPAMCQAAAQ